MALQRPLSTALACQNCQRWILRSFISAVGGQSAVQTGPANVYQRPFSIAHRRRNEARERIQQVEKEEDHPLNEINDAFTSPPDTATTKSSPQTSYHPPRQEEHLPWYLQHAPPIQQPSPFPSRQQLPPLPPHAPPILAPLLSHLSVELGIDDLQLLDLRSLDPPPALGANLLMLLGTARSEKHLHITSDRLCRWLRSTYSLRPHADGLLGRNEMKLKLKRRAKRSRLLSTVGAKGTGQSEAEEGIRTGWVCVNVGRVEGGEVPGQQRRMEGVVGFGPAEEGCSVVVQLLTEEKRGEVDLESLWEEYLGRARRRERGEQEGGGREANEMASPRETDVRSEQESSPSFNGYQQFAAVSNQSAGQQLRTYHTSSRNLQATLKKQHVEPDDYLILAAKPSKEETPPKLRYEAPPTPPDASKLADMVADLKLMSPSHALQTLGRNVLSASQHLSLDSEIDSDKLTPQQASPSPEIWPWLRTFYAAMPPYPTPAHWHEHIAMLAYARRLGVHEIHSTVLFAQLRNMQIAGLVPQECTFRLAMEAALTPPAQLTSHGEFEYALSPSKIGNILAVLEDMESCGYDPASPDILSLLHSAYVGHAPVDTTLDLKTAVSNLSAHRLRRFAREGDWFSFWLAWRSYPARFLPREAGMYTVLFSILGEGLLGDGRQMVEVLKMGLEDMEREEPMVVLEGDGELARAVVRALEFVEPKLRGTSDGGSREWRGWYERCLGVSDRFEKGRSRKP